MFNVWMYGCMDVWLYGVQLTYEDDSRSQRGSPVPTWGAGKRRAEHPFPTFEILQLVEKSSIFGFAYGRAGK